MSTTGELRQLISLLSAFDSARDSAGESADDDRLLDVHAEARAILGTDRLDRTGDPAQFLSAARTNVAKAIVADQGPVGDATTIGPNRALFMVVTAGLVSLPRRVRSEIRHIFIDRPRSILIRLGVTLAMSVGLVLFYEFSGWASYSAAQLMLYLFSAVGGSVVCTNALCFDALRVRRLLGRGVPMWRILMTKNLAMLILMLLSGLPAIAILWLGPSHLNLAALLDQFVVMMFVWMGIANVLSVVSPLRRAPLPARFHDGTWIRFLASFVISYSVGLTVNLMIYWRLWAREAASDEITGGAWSAFALVLVSSLLMWVLLTVFASVCGENRELRLVLDREMVPYRRPAGPQNITH